MLAAHQRRHRTEQAGHDPDEERQVEGVDEWGEADPPPPICVPEKIATSTFGSIEAETRPIASAIDTTKPDCISIIRVPAPTLACLVERHPSRRSCSAS